MNLRAITHGQFHRLLNMGLRGLTLVSRFLFIFLLAKYIAPEEVGLYGLVTATVGYALFVVGLDFYTYSTREIANSPSSEWGWVLKSHGMLTLFLYLLMLPVFLLVFQFALLPWEVAPFFFLLVVSEHFCQELMRFFIAASKQLHASIVLFFRQAVWAVLAVAAFSVVPVSRSLDFVFSIWVGSALLGIGYGFVVIYKLRLGGWLRSVDMSWILLGVKVALPFLVATLALRGLFTIDRYWLESLAGLEVVAAYVVFYGVASTLLAFLDAGVFSYAYPGMISAVKQGDVVLYRKKMRDMILLTGILSSLFICISLIVLPYLVSWLDKEAYSSNISLYYWLLAGTVVNALSLIPHYGLYAQRIDKPIVHSQLLSILIFVLSTMVISSFNSYVAVPVGLLLAQFFVLVWKTYFYCKKSDKKYLQLLNA